MKFQTTPKVISTDEFRIIASFISLGFKPRFRHDRGKLFAEFENSPEVQEALELLTARRLRVEPVQYYYVLHDLKVLAANGAGLASRR